MSTVYNNPLYYEIAFSFRDIPAEAALFEECFQRFSKIPVRSVLELGCGNCPHLEELHRRGYRYTGLDLNRAMLDYCREKAARIGAEANLVEGDMVDFSLPEAVDFAYIMLGSLATGNTKQLVDHFDSVANALNRGGLYLLDWCILFEPLLEAEGGSSWKMERDGISVKTTVTWEPVNRVEQVFDERIKLEVNDHGHLYRIEDTEIKRAIYPQEFLFFISGRTDFEFVGWFNNWDLSQPLGPGMKISRPITIVRRT